jgi:hypothetical protein
MNDPFVGKLTFFRVYSGTLKAGSYVSTRPRGSASASAASCRCTPTSVRSGGGLRRRHRRGHRPQGHDHRRHALRRGKQVILESMTFPEPVISSRSSRRRRPTRTRWARRSRSSPTRTRPSGPHRPGDRSDDHLRDGRAPPRDHRGPACSASSRWTPTSAGRRSRTARRSARRSTTSRGSSSVRPVAGSVRPRRHQHRPGRAGLRASSSRTRSSAA